MSTEIYLVEKISKRLCFVGTTTDNKTGTWANSENVLSFIVQNEGNELTVVEGHSASNLCHKYGFMFLEPKQRNKRPD